MTLGWLEKKFWENALLRAWLIAVQNGRIQGE
jgi:hypothetical protein